MARFRVENLNGDNARDWERVNAQAEDGSFDHSLGWISTLEEGHGIRSHCFMVYRDDEPVALCPLFERHMKGFRGLATLPESDLYYLIVSEPSDREILDPIMDQVLKIAKAERSAFALLSFSTPDLGDAFAKRFSDRWTILPHNLNGNMFLDMNELPPNVIWESVFTNKRKQRRYINGFKELGYRIRETRSEEDLREFHGRYSRNLIDKGAKPYDLTFFQHLLAHHPDEVRFTLLEKDDDLAAGAIMFYNSQKRTIYLRYSFTNKDPSHMSGIFRRSIIPVIWDAITYAYDRGGRTACMGGTPADPNEPTHKIKAEFGCTYENIYSYLIPTSPLFSALYRTHRALKEKGP